MRIPVVLSVNGDDRTLTSAFAWLRDNVPGVPLELLPYHRFGEEKYRRLGLPLPDSAFTAPTEEQMRRWGSMAREFGIQEVSYK